MCRLSARHLKEPLSARLAQPLELCQICLLSRYRDPVATKDAVDSPKGRQEMLASYRSWLRGLVLVRLLGRFQVLLLIPGSDYSTENKISSYR
jgi:hypothetical protein